MNLKPFFLSVLIGSALLGETKLSFHELPAAVQAAAKAQTDGAEITGSSKEVEKGKTVYEVETRTNGKSRDLSFDKAGNLLEVEQEIALDALPSSALAALQKRAAGGTIRKVESIAQGDFISYEATFVTKSGKNAEIAVNADGTPHRD